MVNNKEAEDIVKKWEDVDATTSSRSGFAGMIETFLRRFRVGGYLFALIPLYFIGILGMGISATPGVFLFNFIQESASGLPPVIYYGAVSCGIILGYFLYGMTLIFVMPLFNWLMPFRLKPFRGAYYSLGAVPWYFHNAFTYIVRYTFLEFITPTPINVLFYKMMGMKIGKGVHINTTNISDPCLIEIGDKVTIGGSVHIISHYASHGYLIVKPVKIHRGATVGLKATIMGDVEIGEGATIAPHEVILPKSRIPAGRKPFVAEEKELLEKKDLPSQDFFKADF
jgi:serine acetyltransferase